MSQLLDPDMFTSCTDDPRPFRVGDKWTAKVLRCLETGSRRFSELAVPLRGITPKILTSTLRAMERDGLVARTVHSEVPRRVTYELTPLGRTLLEPLEAGCAWTRRHLDELRAARERYGSDG